MLVTDWFIGGIDRAEGTACLPVSWRRGSRKSWTARRFSLESWLAGNGAFRSPALALASWSAKRRNVAARWAVRFATVQGGQRVAAPELPGGQIPRGRCAVPGGSGRPRLATEPLTAGSHQLSRSCPGDAPCRGYHSSPAATVRASFCHPGHAMPLRLHPGPGSWPAGEAGGGLEVFDLLAMVVEVPAQEL